MKVSGSERSTWSAIPQIPETYGFDTRRNTMTRLLSILAVTVLTVSAYAQTGDGNAPPVTNSTVTTPGGTVGSIALFSGKSTIAKSVAFQKAGNIGIGTTTPTSPLTVNGSIQSLAGGFTFPDNTMQTTAGLTTINHDGSLNGSGSANSPLTITVPLSLTENANQNVLTATAPDEGIALVGNNTSLGYGTGILGTSYNGNGVEGEGLTTNGVGVYGIGTGDYGFGVSGVEQQAGGIAVYGWGLSGYAWAGWFQGDVNITGNVSKSGGSFKIDDPLDPANMYLYHSFVESPDMKDMYDGTVTTDAAGDATVQLPEWFQALNSSFRYQLTPIGQFAQAIVATEVENNQFTIKTDKPFVKVSWQVTGTRQDAWANAHRIPVEIDKPEDERGYYIHPELFGEGPEKSIIAAHHPAGPAPDGPHHSR
jgi:hypothetical protein